MAEEERMKHLWATHASKRREVDSNRETASTVGRVERAKPRSARDSTGRKRYLGAWRLWSVFTTQSKGQLARSRGGTGSREAVPPRSCSRAHRECR